MTNICPACEIGTLHSRVGDRVIQFEGTPLRVHNLHYSECSHCGEEVVLPAQSKLNEVVYADAKKNRLGLWSCGKIESFLKEWRITQVVASQVFGGGANAFSKYVRGEVIHSKSMDLLMKVFNECADARELLIEYAGVRVEGGPEWETIRQSPAARSRMSANSAIRKYGSSRRTTAANGDHWQTCDVANG